VRKRLMTAYTVSGALAGLAGLLWVGRYSIAFTELASGDELAVIAACVIGGVSTGGGVGTVCGALDSREQRQAGRHGRPRVRVPERGLRSRLSHDRSAARSAGSRLDALAVVRYRQWPDAESPAKGEGFLEQYAQILRIYELPPGT
jgi:hypothetical protein